MESLAELTGNLFFEFVTTAQLGRDGQYPASEVPSGATGNGADQYFGIVGN